MLGVVAYFLNRQFYLKTLLLALLRYRGSHYSDLIYETFADAISYYNI